MESRKRGLDCGSPEEAGGRKADQPEGGTAWETSWSCGLWSWGLEDAEELSREREEADSQVGRRARAGTPRFKT